MKRLVGFLALCLVLPLVFGVFSTAQGQLLLQESFETTSGWSSNPALCTHSNGGDYFDRYTTATAPTGLSTNLGNLDGDYFIGAEDTDSYGEQECMVGGPIWTITLDALNITGYTALEVTIAVNGKNALKYDDTDYLSVYRNIDGGGDVLIGQFAGIGAGTNHKLGLDTDLDGDGDVEITDYANFQDYTFAVGGTGASMVIKVVARFDAGDEEVVFDNIRVNEGSGDTDPPEVLSATVISATEVDVYFNEDVDQTTAETLTNYTIDNGIGNPSAAVRDATTNSIVHLTVSTLTSYLTYMLEVINVEDLNSNAIDADTAYFVYVEEIGDVVITEFMPNPNAVYDSYGEWFEIYNNTGAQINLNGWIIRDNYTADTVVGDNFVAADDYFVFCINETLAVNGGVPTDYVFVNIALANTADQIVIYDNTGQMQDSVAYDAAWGVAAGASHELKDVTYENNVDTSWCIATNAWIGSAGDFGTPGEDNDCTAGDVTPPTISNVAAVSATQVNVLFSEDVDQTTAETTTNYSIDNGIGTPSAAVRDAGNNALVHLTVSTLSTGITYTITINNVEDLAGNPILPNSQATFEFVSVNPNDLLITEIMPNPNAVFDQYGEWFEVYNSTGSSIDMNGFILHDNSGTYTISGAAVVASHDYFVFCCNETLATNGGVPTDYEYPYAYPAGLELGNTADVVKICTPGDVIIDSVQYASASWPYGAGWSMQLKDLAYNNDDDTSWCAAQSQWIGSTGDNGTPGEATECGPPPEPVLLTICQARTEDACADLYYLDSLITVRGVVSMADTCEHIAYMQDDGCGIAVYGYAVSDTLLPPARQMRAGDSIQVTGYLTSYAGLAEIAFAFDYDVEAVLLDSDKVVPITDVACALISDAADAGDDSCTGEAYESMKIRVSGIEFVATGTFAGNTNYQAVCSNDDTIQVRIHVCSDFVGTTIPTGPYNVVGNVGQYDWSICQCQGYQVFPLEFTPADEPCVDPDSLTIVRSSTLENVILRWRPNAGQNCDCYKIYSSTDPMAVFPGAGWTEVACVCSTTMYEYAPPVSTTAKLFYIVTAVASCP